MTTDAVTPSPALPDSALSKRLPRTAYVLLWFPLSSETFIFREVQRLAALGMPLRVYTMYGQQLRGSSEEMRRCPLPVLRLGAKSTFRILGAFFRALGRDPGAVWQLMRKGFFRRIRNLESLGENVWCFLAGFLLAEQARRDKVELLHSAWGNGCATAVWVASRVSGIPFAFTGRAGDIYPEDGILREKCRDALFIRTNNLTNVPWLQSFCPPDEQDKVHAVYNGLTLAGRTECEMPFTPPFRLLAVGRFCRTKGFPELLTMMARLRRECVAVRLTLVGDGGWRRKLHAMRRRLGLDDVLDMPCFLPNDRIREYMHSHDMLIVPSVVHANGDRDGIPNVIMEALSCRMPVIATDVCGIREVIEDGVTGLLIPQRDPAALADAVRRMLADRQAAQRMAEAGRERVLAMFDSEKNIRQLAELYAEQYADWQASRPDVWLFTRGLPPQDA